MEDIKLNLPLSYSSDLVIVIIEIIIILILLIIFMDVYWESLLNYFSQPDVPHIKDVYLKRLYNLNKLADNRNEDVKELYFKLSKIIREFIEKTTSINVLNLSKSEIKKLDIKDLDRLMEEYYPPEFSSSIDGDIKRSIENTISLIKTWE